MMLGKKRKRRSRKDDELADVRNQVLDSLLMGDPNASSTVSKE